MRKWIIRVGLAVVALLVVGGVVLYFSLNGIIRGQVEQQSTKSLNLQTALQSARFSPFAGNLNLADYRVASPPGFSAEPMLSLGGLDVTVSYGQLRGDPVRVGAITIDRPRMLLEHANGKFNVKALADNLPPGNPSQPKPENGETLRVIIDQITVRDPVVVLRPGLPGLQDVTIPIGTFEMRNVGSGDGAQNGVAVKQVVTELVTTLAAKATNSKDVPEQLRLLLAGDLTAVAQQYIPGEAGKLVGSFLSPDTLKDPGKAIGAKAEGLLNQATTNPAGAVDSVRGLLDGVKKDDKRRDDKRK